MNNLMAKMEGQRRSEPLADFSVGDTVIVHQRIREGEKERIQLFQGTVITRAGGGTGETFTVRKISFGIGVERVYPVNSANVVEVEVVRYGKVRRSRLFYLRDRVGKRAKVKERRRVAKK